MSAQIATGSMHERKLEMAKRSSGFVCMPGGYGTFEEVRYGTHICRNVTLSTA